MLRSMSRSMLTVVLACIVSLFAFGALAGDPPCPCIPMGQLWTATAYPTWTDAIAAVISANGDPNTFALPTRSSDYPWIVVRRVAAEGAMISSPNLNPFDVEPFQSTDLASLRFQTIDHELAPMLMTTGDGNVLVIHLHDGARTHAVRH